MQLIKNIRQLEYLDYLIRKGATGTPKQLARRMNISERQVYRIIDELKAMGLPIAYSTTQSRYYYKENVQLNIEVTINGINIFKAKNSS